MVEDDDLFGDIDLHAFKDSIVRQMEENEKQIREHYQKLQNQEKEIESQNKKLFNFVCDWQ